MTITYFIVFGKKHLKKKHLINQYLNLHMTCKAIKRNIDGLENRLSNNRNRLSTTL